MISRRVPEVFHGQLQNPELPILILSPPVFEGYIYNAHGKLFIVKSKSVKEYNEKKTSPQLLIM